MEFEEYKKKKIIEITQIYNNQISYERQLHARNTLNIRRNFLLLQFQRITQIRQLDFQLENKISSIQKTMNQAINNIKNLKLNSLNNIRNKNALLVGINYENTEYQLNGCINDVSLIRNYISQKGFSNITMFTDKTDKKPTKNNIITELQNFLINSNENDLLYFHYSGHGSYVQDYNNDELDAKDETIVSQDLKNITDDELISVIKQKLPKNRTLIAVFDSCHSGTVLDLKYSISNVNNKFYITENMKYDDIHPNIILLSGCLDSQYSQECVTNTGVNGLLTWALYETLTKNNNLSLKSIYLSVKNILKDIGATQIPQLSMGSLIDIDTRNIL